MEQFEKIGAIFGTIGTFFLLMINIFLKTNEAFQTIWGRIGIFLAVVVTISLLIFSLYSQIRRRYKNSSTILKGIAKDIDRFVGRLQNAQGNELNQMIQINPHSIKINAMTRRISDLKLDVTEIFQEATSKPVEMYVNKGFNDGIRENMFFRVRHKPSATVFGVYPAQQITPDSFLLEIPFEDHSRARTGTVPGMWKVIDILVVPEAPGNLSELEALLVRILCEAT